MTYEFNAIEQDILSFIKENGLIEFKDHESDSLDVTGSYHRSDTLQLVSNGFIEHDFSCKNSSYKLSKVGNKVFDSAINETIL